MTIFTKANKIAIGKIFLLLYDHTTIPNNVSFPIFVSLSDFSVLLNIKSSIVHHFVVNLLIVFILSRTNYHTIKQSNDNKNFFHHKHIHLILNLLSESILIYALPTQKRFSHAEIYAGALKGKGLELAYSDSMIDNFLLGVQGSGYVDFGEGNLNYFAYAGQNGYKYQSVGRLLVEDGEIPKEKMSIQAIREWVKANPSRAQGLLERNPSYVFFKNDPYGKVKGAAGVPLVPMASVASDRSVVPMGSVLLVEVPQIDNEGNWTKQHQLHLMVALDVGGAVNGHHFDLYRGIGDQAGHIAGLSKHYGRVWVLR